jgi:hypothetical protein
MSLRDDLRSLTQRLAGRRPSAEEERLVELFRNRAELKKELTALDEERHRLLDRLKLQEGATMRVEEQYAALEQYLGRPDEGYKSLAYFQLRALWRAGSKRLEQFASDLARQQKDRERRAQMAEFERDKRARLGDVDREFVEAKVLADQLQAEQKLAQQRLGELAGFWNHFRRRKLEDAIAARALRLETAQAAVTDLGDARHAIEVEPPPAFEGISLEGKRAVNLAVVAYAEWLCDRLAADGLADLARQTTLRRVFESGYGSREECLALMERAAKAIADLERQSDDLVELKSRTDRLRRTARYRGENDPIPMQDSISPPDTPGRAHGSVNVLLEEYFEIYGALLR